MEWEIRVAPDHWPEAAKLALYILELALQGKRNRCLYRRQGNFEYLYDKTREDKNAFALQDLYCRKPIAPPYLR